MHIPDGFLSPQTCAACFAVAIPAWIVAWRGIKGRFQSSTASQLGIAAAFVFLLQMVNVPIPGGTSGHAVGTALVAIALGPAAAVVSVSMALALQAIIFGDGGILAFGANSLTMAIIQAVIGVGVWRVIVPQDASEKVKSVGAFAAGYVSAVGGAIATGLLLGLQPALFHNEAGLPLYFPLGLKLTMPAMVGSHLLIGFIEGGITLGAVRALGKIPTFKWQAPIPLSPARAVTLAIIAIVLVVPIGVLAPAIMRSGEPWGEWSPEETAKIGQQASVPAGMAAYAEKYNAPVPDYQFKAADTITGESVQYTGAALLGVIIVTALCFPLHYLQQRRLRRMRGN